MAAPTQSLEARTVYYEDMEIGQSESLNRIVTEADIAAFADLTGDRNPVHLDKAYGEASRFGNNIAHGLYIASLFSTILGMRLPGPGAIYLSQTLQFRAPVFPGDNVVVSAKIQDKKDKGNRVTLACVALVGDRKVVTGEAVVIAPARADD